MQEIEVVVAHRERATLRVGDVFLKIDTEQARIDREVEVMARAPIPTPEVLWRKPPVLALAAVPGAALGLLQDRPPRWEPVRDPAVVLTPASPSRSVTEHTCRFRRAEPDGSRRPKARGVARRRAQLRRFRRGRWDSPTRSSTGSNARTTVSYSASSSGNCAIQRASGSARRVWLIPVLSRAMSVVPGVLRWWMRRHPAGTNDRSLRPDMSARQSRLLPLPQTCNGL